MPPAPPTKPEYIPPSLAYLVIYNPTLHPETSDADDDDDIEQAHIVFYTARERAVSRDLMLRQVGLAKALTNFAEIFSTDGCDSVHSQKRRMIMLRPEPDFWMIACVDVPQAPRSAAVSSSSTGKDKPKHAPKKSIDKGKIKAQAPDVLEYRENSLFDEVLRKQLRRGYEEFKLLYGQFQSLLDQASRANLEKTLEKFFTPWAWKWDVDVLGACGNSASGFDEGGPNFGSYLGLPLHPLLCSNPQPPDLSAILENIYQLSPPPAIPIVLCLNPPSTFPPPDDAQIKFPVILSQYLLSIIPPPAISRPRRISGASVATVKQAPAISAANTITPASFIPPMPKINVPMDLGLGKVTSTVVNPKKWGWPEYLTFGRGTGSAAASRDVSPVRAAPLAAATPSVRNEGDNPYDPTSPGMKSEGNPLSPAPTQPEANPLDLGTPSASSEQSDPYEDDEGQSKPNAVRDFAYANAEKEEVSEPHTPQIDRQSLQEAMDAMSPTPREDSLEAEAGITEAEPTDPDASEKEETNEKVAEQPDEESSHPIPPFTPMNIHLEVSGALGVQRFKSFYITCNRLVFAFVDVEGNESTAERLQEMSKRIYLLLKELNATMEREDLKREARLTGRQGSDGADPLPPQPSSSRHIALQPLYEDVTTRTIAYEPTSPHFFTANQLLSSHPNMTEVFLRANSMKWFAAKRRGMTDKKAPGKEVYAEVGKKDASIVDVDQELEALF